MFLVYSQFSFVLEAREWTQTQHTAHTFLFVYSRLYIFLQRSRTAATYICTSIISLTWRDSLLLTIYTHMCWTRSDLRRRALYRLMHAQSLQAIKDWFTFADSSGIFKFRKSITLYLLVCNLHRFKLKGKYNMDYGLHYTSIHHVNLRCCTVAHLIHLHPYSSWFYHSSSLEIFHPDTSQLIMQSSWFG